MVTGRDDRGVRQLRRVLRRHGAAGLTDRELLEAYAARGDGAAFEALVRRYGGLVFGVCRRVLHDQHDAEDAFQAAFLVLARKAGEVAAPDQLAAWLYGVAYNTARKARGRIARRRVRERPAGDAPEPAAPDPRPAGELLPLLDRELSRLPAAYRAAVVLCDLEGKTRREAARLLGCPEGTLAGRLTRARQMLARRLTRHAPALSAGAVGLWLARASAGPPPAGVSAATVAAGLTGDVPTSVWTLTQEVLRDMFWTQCKRSVALAVVVAAALLAGEGLFAPGPRAGEPAARTTAAPEGKATPARTTAGPEAKVATVQPPSIPPSEDTLRVLFGAVDKLRAENAALQERVRQLEEARDAKPAEAKAGSDKLVIRVYNIAELAGPDGQGLEELAEILQGLVAPNSWEDKGGPATAAFFSATKGLVISQTPEVHEQIAEMLGALHAGSSAPASRAAPARGQPQSGEKAARKKRRPE